MRSNHVGALRCQSVIGFRHEQLEDRRLMSVTLGVNAITNPGAESNTGSSTGNDVITPSGWTQGGAGSATVVKYGVSGFPSSSSPGPSSRGNNFFSGGPSGLESDLFQTIDASNQASQIDAGHIKFNLSAFLGGFSSQNDQASVFINLSNASHSFINQFSVGPVTNTDRGNVTGLLSRSLTGTLPAGTRFIQVQIHMDPVSGGYNDGYADNLSLVLTNPTATGSVTGTVYNDINGNGTKDSGDGGLANVKVFIDKNNNGTLDSGEPNTTTNSSGVYTISGLAAANYALREIVPSTYRATTANPQSITITGGVNTSGKNFGDSQTALISGNVFNDANGDKIKDNGETGISGVTVYLDFNNNGQLDSFELKTTTDSSGNYKFVVPFGTYVIREVVPSGKTQTVAPSNPFTLSKGQVASGKNFGDK
jgi:hypothetical protein